jgi:hypothetical protein
MNLIVLFLASLLCLQMPVRRQEERFEVTEPVMLRQPQTGALATLTSIDMSLSGAGLVEPDGGAPWRVGDALQAYVSQVGWLPARVARTNGGMLGLEFQHEGMIERDLLIRKLFTGGQNTAADNASTWSVTLGLLKRIWTADMRVRAAAPAEDVEAPAPSPLEKLPAQSFVAPPNEKAAELAEALARLDRAA